MKFVFLFPPSSDPTTMPLSLCRIKGAGKHLIRDINIEVLDENYGFVRYVISTFLSSESEPFFKERILKSLAVLKSKDLFLNIKNYAFAYSTILEVFQRFSKRFEPTFVGYATQRFKQDIKDTKQVNLLLESADLNPYLEYFYLRSKYIIEMQPDLLGISIIYYSQLIPALTVSKILKDIKKDLLIVLGGPCATRLREKILKRFTFIDGIVNGDAEAFFERLKGVSLNKSILIELIKKPTNYFSHLNYPIDFSWTDPKGYLLPEPVFLLDITRGCYYKKCVFCSYGHKHAPYRKISIDELLRIIRENSIKRVFFSVDAVDLGFLEKIAKEILKKNIEITYCLDARLEKRFKDKDFVKLLYESGCRAISFGMESASQYTLDKMKKGIEAKDFPEILENLFLNGIHIQLHLIYGFPTEKSTHFKETIEFLKSHREKIVTVGISEFSLLKGSLMEKIYQQFGIPKLIPDGELGLEYRYEKRPDPFYPSFEETKRLLFSLFPVVGRLTGSTTDYLIYASYYRPEQMKELLKKAIFQ